MRLLRQVQHEHAYATDSEQEEGYQAVVHEGYIHEAIDARIRSLLSRCQAPPIQSSQGPADHEKRVERIIHLLCGMEKGLDPYQL